MQAEEKSCGGWCKHLLGAEEGLSYYTLPHSQQELYANSQAQESIQRS